MSFVRSFGWFGRFVLIYSVLVGFVSFFSGSLILERRYFWDF